VARGRARPGWWWSDTERASYDASVMFLHKPYILYSAVLGMISCTCVVGFGDDLEGGCFVWKEGC
jgi:hypothetical protein